MLNKVKELKARLRKSKDGQVLAGNFGYLMLLQVAGYVFPLITIPYLARVIGVDGFGKIAFAAAVVLWFKTISEWGFNYTATRDIAKNRDSPDKVAEIFSTVLWARVLLMLISLAFLLALTAAVPYLRENRTIILLTFLMVPGHIIFPEWFFQAMERMKYITIFNLLSKAFFTAMVFVAIKDTGDFILHPVLMSLGYLVSGMLAMYLIVVKWKVKIQAPDWRSVISTIHRSTDVFLNTIMPNLYNSFSTVLLGFYGGSVSNGFLDAGRKFVELGQQFLSVVSRVFFPFLSRKISKHSAYVKLHLGLASVLSAATVAAAPWLIDLFFTPEFKPAVLVLQIMALSLIFLSLSNIYGTNYMIIQRHEKALRNLTVAASISGFCVAFPLIHYFGYVGAAITITLTRAVLGIAIMVKAKKLMREAKGDELVWPGNNNENLV